MNKCSFMAMHIFTGQAETQMPEHRHSSTLYARDCARTAQPCKTCCRHPSEKTRKSDKRGTVEREGSVLLTANARENHPTTAGCQSKHPEKSPTQYADLWSHWRAQISLILSARLQTDKASRTHNPCSTGVCGAKETVDWTHQGQRQEKQDYRYRPQINS